MSKTLKTLECDRCCREVDKVSLDAVTVLCWLCSMKNTTYYENPDGSPDSKQLPEPPRND